MVRWGLTGLNSPEQDSRPAADSGRISAGRSDPGGTGLRFGAA